ncbi:hypothetical protein Cni_G15822 [Canna indica]|uniref:Reverse transcriptase domain-containing protein n=1 Tax=Canna indica TaxID=4628 RepID=A0AAQ3QC05_9LILI|nr:hypothetical protein Cni_G15822 [Canna indica]
MKGINFHCKINDTSMSFGSSKGIRQGDLLSPYLFIILEQLLTEMLKKAAKEKKIDCFTMGDIELSHTLYADDIVFFVKGNKKSCGNLMRLLNDYCYETGQKINLHKSKVGVFYPEKSKLKQSIWLSK